ncbi:MAG: cell division protein ZapE [Thioalkalispiraceae bacterium]|jgi:cell division protein ZapE
MTPTERYQQDLLKPGFREDPVQARAVESLTFLQKTIQQAAQQPPGFFHRLIRKVNTIPGIYLVGSVGRGKTYLMDLFYECLEGIEKQRVHYHRFMLDLHEKLRHLPKSPDPLIIISREIAEQVHVLCIDEFHVTDVTDAMLLSGLLNTLFKNGVTLVATSNTHIDDLYLNGLQRERFMSAIHLLKDYTVEIDLLDGTDYRLLHLEKGGTFKIEKEKNNQVWLRGKFNELSPTSIRFSEHIQVHKREIKTVAMSDDVVWFEFSELCDTPRAAKDYLEIARQFHTVVISDIPVLSPAKDSAAKRFMHLIDALYDHRVKLIATSETTPEKLYQGNLLKGMFDRTVSRLIEMASHDYLASAHRL